MFRLGCVFLLSESVERWVSFFVVAGASATGVSTWR